MQSHTITAPIATHRLKEGLMTTIEQLGIKDWAFNTREDRQAEYADRERNDPIERSIDGDI